jgi:hypothetical protein
MMRKILLVIFTMLIGLSIVSCNDSGADGDITYELLEIEYNRNFLGYSIPVEFYYLGHIYTVKNTGEVHSIQSGYDEDDEPYNMFSYNTLNASLTNYRGEIKKLIQQGDSFFGLSNLGELVGYNLPNAFFDDDSPVNATYGRAVFNNIISLDKGELIVDFDVSVNNSSFNLFILTSKSRVLAFGDNSKGKLFDQTTINPKNFIDVTNNFPLNDEEIVVSMDNGMFYTNQERILTSGLFNNLDSDVIIDLLSSIDLATDEEIVSISSNYASENYSILTSNNHLYINLRPFIPIFTNFSISDVAGVNIELEPSDVGTINIESEPSDELISISNEETIALEAVDLTNDALPFEKDVYDLLNLTDGEEIVYVKTSNSATRVLTSENRIISITHMFFFNSEEPTEVNSLSFDIELYESESVIDLIIVSSNLSYVLTSYGRIFVQVYE